MLSAESETKRVRFNGPELGGAEATYFAHPEGTDANACTHLYFGPGDESFPPEFSNQLFEDERLVGWPNPALHVRYHPLTLAPVAVELVHDGSGDAAREAVWLAELQRCLAPVLRGRDEALVRHRRRGVGGGVSGGVGGEVGDEAALPPAAEAAAAEAAAIISAAAAAAAFTPPGAPVRAYACAGQRFRIYRCQPRDDHVAAADATGSSDGISTDNNKSSSGGSESASAAAGAGAAAAARARLVFHEQCQKVGLWFIDGAEAVALDDARWEVLYLFRVQDGDQGDEAPCVALAGYVTVREGRLCHKISTQALAREQAHAGAEASIPWHAELSNF
jgi:hypothetical protein